VKFGKGFCDEYNKAYRCPKLHECQLYGNFIQSLGVQKVNALNAPFDRKSKDFKCKELVLKPIQSAH